MPQLKDIKERIESVAKTRKMTQAMKMVAAAKFKRFSKTAVASRHLLKEIDHNITRVTGMLNGLCANTFMEEVTADKELVIVVAGDRGLCGGFNTNILKFAKKLVDSSEKQVDMLLFGRKSVQFFANKGYSVKGTFEQFQDSLSSESIDTLYDSIFEKFESGEYSRVLLLYNEFKSAIATNLMSKQLFPVSWSEEEDSGVQEELIVEPSPDAVLEQLCELYVKHSLNNAFLESVAAEQGARMAAMDSATDNAGEMIKELTLIYNRQRQAQITTELSEIVSGAEALVS